MAPIHHHPCTVDGNERSPVTILILNQILKLVRITSVILLMLSVGLGQCD